MKNITVSTLLIFLFFASTLHAQNKNDKIWQTLLNNDRKAALQLVNKIKTKKASMEELVLKQIVKYDNGIYAKDKDFITSFLSQKDFDKFLFPLWNEMFVFKDYLTQGFDKENTTNISYFLKQKINNQTVKSGLIYLDGIANRHKNNFNYYHNSLKRLKAIGKWQYCGVFENLNNSGLDIEYAPEKTAFSKKPFNANSNGDINWFTPSYNVNSAYQFMRNHEEYGAGINYAQTFFKLDKSQTLIFKLGIGKASKLWLNDILIFEEIENHITELDAHTIKVTVPKGNNRILLKTTNDSYSYFILRVFDENNKLLDPEDLNFTSKYLEYNKSTSKNLNIKNLTHQIEEYFSNLDNSYSSYFKNYLLIQTYLRNSKEKEAKKIIEKYREEFPKSTILRTFLIQCYNIEKDFVKAKEINENIINDDPNSLLVLLSEITDTNKLFKLPIDKMNKRLDEIGAAMDMEIIKKTIELLKIIRREDKEALKQALDEVYQVAENLENPRLMSSYATPYASIFNDEEKTIKLLEDINSKYFNYSAYNNLIYKYNKLNKIDSVLLLRQDFIKKFPDELVSYVAYINDLQKYEYYEEALEYIDKGFDIFPYSFTLMRLKGEVLVQLKKKKEALKWLKKSFTHDSGNSDLRNKIKDLEKTADPIKEVLIEKPYDFIAKERGKIKTETNYGLNIILEEKNVQVFKEGGNKTHTTYIYEVTSKKGIETLKEYNLGLSWGYIINKSEIIKPDGKIVPAERSKSNFVFNNLSIGDVVYIDFETYSSATGRFYKDFYDTYQTASYYPTNKIIYRLILEKGETIQTKITNGNLEFNKKKIGDFDVFEWTKNNSPILPSYESYMPEDCDVATILHVSTINDWSEISNWYSDLVRTQIKYNSTVNNLFDKLFLNGHKHLSDIEKAKKIYYYMMENLTYSYVSFKQSGFVPQKPSKTITTKLGDCKDFSTLFLALAKKADLEANLVLVSTSDLGINNLVLPSTDFNHCIVRVMIDGKEHYIELTNKYLPFDSTPRSLIKALALNIPYNSSETNQNTLFVLNKKAQTNNLRKVDHKLTIGKQTKKLEIINTSLNSNSYYRKLLSKKNIIELKKEIEELYENKIDLDLSFIDYKVNKNIKQDPEIIFTTYFKINNKFKKIGKMKLLRLPNFSTPYTSDIISKDERHYTIDYNKYESIDKYIINYDIILTDDMKFVEIPENAIHTFKNHQFSIKYNLINSNTELKVSLICKIDKNDISPEDYQDFKKFVNSVLEEYEVLIGFK